MLKDITPAVIVSSCTFIVALIVAIFGNNINDQLKEAEIVYSSQKVELRLPSRMSIVNKVDSIPDSYRQIIIKNIGSKSSQNLKILINLDGSEIDSEIKCIESIKDTIHSKSQIQIELDRLASNAEVICKVWLKQNQNIFSIKSIDNFGAKDVLDENEVNETNFVRIGALLVMLVIVCFLLYRLYILPIKTAYLKLTENHTELQGQFEQVSNELGDIRAKMEVEDHPDNINFMSKLQELVNEHNSKKN